jgi:hypothetical protein
MLFIFICISDPWLLVALALGRSGPRSLLVAAALTGPLGSDPFVSSARTPSSPLLLCFARPLRRFARSGALQPTPFGQAHSVQRTRPSPLGQALSARPTWLHPLASATSVARPGRFVLGAAAPLGTPQIGTLGRTLRLGPLGLEFLGSVPRLGPRPL